MKFSAILAAVAAATVVNAQGYNSTSKPASSEHPQTQASVFDSRTVNVPKPSAHPTTALTSYYTYTSSCGSIQVVGRSTSVYPLTTRATSTFAGSSASSTGGAVRTAAAFFAGAGGLVAALAL